MPTFRWPRPNPEMIRNNARSENIARLCVVEAVASTCSSSTICGHAIVCQSPALHGAHQLGFIFAKQDGARPCSRCSGARIRARSSSTAKSMIFASTTLTKASNSSAGLASATRSWTSFSSTVWRVVSFDHRRFVRSALAEWRSLTVIKNRNPFRIMKAKANAVLTRIRHA